MQGTDKVFTVSWPISGAQGAASVHHVQDPDNDQRTLCGRKNEYRHSERGQERYGWRFVETADQVIEKAKRASYLGICKPCAIKLAKRATLIMPPWLS